MEKIPLVVINDIEILPQAKDIEIRPQVKGIENLPQAKDTEIWPQVKNIENLPQAKDIEIRPQVKDIEIIFTQPLRSGRIWYKVNFFKRSLSGLNSEFSFS